MRLNGLCTGWYRWARSARVRPPAGTLFFVKVADSSAEAARVPARRGATRQPGAPVGGRRRTSKVQAQWVISVSMALVWLLTLCLERT